jgi:hypothetical protein
MLKLLGAVVLGLGLLVLAGCGPAEVTEKQVFVKHKLTPPMKLRGAKIPVPRGGEKAMKFRAQMIDEATASVEVDPADGGVTAEVKPTKLTKDTKAVELTVKATPKAKPGEYKVTMKVQHPGQEPTPYPYNYVVKGE